MNVKKTLKKISRSMDSGDVVVINKSILKNDLVEKAILNGTLVKDGILDLKGKHLTDLGWQVHLEYFLRLPEVKEIRFGSERHSLERLKDIRGIEKFTGLEIVTFDNEYSRNYSVQKFAAVIEALKKCPKLETFSFKLVTILNHPGLSSNMPLDMIADHFPEYMEDFKLHIVDVKEKESMVKFKFHR